MGFRSFIIKPFAKLVARSIHRWSSEPHAAQDKVFDQLINQGRKTRFGEDHNFKSIESYKHFKDQVPIRDYEGHRPYVDRIISGEPDVLWKGLPLYFAKTSGTTSGVKYIPLTKDSMPNHFGTARNALFNYYARTGKGKWLDGKMIFLSGSPELTKTGTVNTGRLSGIVNHEVPGWLRTNQLPSYGTNCIEDWETKLDKIVEETINQDMRLISGIPPWVKMYYERLLEKSGKKNIESLFPNFSVFVYGGVNYEPYRQSLEELIGRGIPSVETYPASEGFIAFQDDPQDPGLLLNVSSGIFFEFVPVEEIFNDNPTRLSLRDIELGVNYAILLNTNAGLWAYNIGDTVKFISKDPYRLLVTGRVKHFISAFGEHVIGKEVEEALNETHKHFNTSTVEFSVAPQVNPGDDSLPFHEWFIEFETAPTDLQAFSAFLDKRMIDQNIYYKDLIAGKVLRPLVVRSVPSGTFQSYMKSLGKLGGQNKVPRLTNDRKMANALNNLI
ncbi:MAG: GH3 auxin-responsive promoter family protein [Saprospiraceae bacterium]|nr:GH3 auxin-responsive promoter family protein [Saprospiraceae bacterium]